jgi:2-keto-4-pentenoate hydratase/2-oxohepta-3-ene-1,7-dioic acid hydratase in catechol pathway
VRLARVAGPDGLPRLAAIGPDGAVVDLALAARRRLERRGATAEAAARLAAAWFPGSLTAALGGGERWWEEAAEALAGAGTDATLDPAGLTWLPPVDPPVMRDCLVFGEHLRNAYGRLGMPPPDQFYEMPVYYKGNPTSLIGHEQAAVWPGYAEAVDYELELGFVVGRAGRNLTPEEAAGHLAGVTIFDDFSARDIQAHEMGAMLGPSKCKDFCTAVGPCVATVDELRLDGLEMVARINGEEWSRGSSADMIWSAAEIVAWVSQCETVQAGDLIGSGTVGRGCALELGRQLAPGDTVELEVAGIGVLRNRLSQPEPPGWRPTPRLPERQQADVGG